VGFVFLYAGLAKWRNFGSFRESLSSLNVWPAAHSWVAFAILPAELLMGSLFLAEVSLRVVSLIAVIVLSAMTIILVREYRLDDGHKCGCFGESRYPIGLGAVLRDLFLVLAAAFICGASWGSVRQGDAGFHFGILSAGLVLLGGLICVLLSALDGMHNNRAPARVHDNRLYTEHLGRP
jgi:hypothetical protein